MSQQHLATYLNDHLAGSVAALELLSHVKAAHHHTEVGLFAAKLQAEIESDQQQLEALMKRLKVARSAPRKAVAWLAEKFTELKLKVDDPAGGSLRLLECLEAVAIGIEGKQALWRALAVASANNPSLQGPDYQHLEQRAKEQRQRLEEVRLEAAKAALDPSQ